LEKTRNPTWEYLKLIIFVLFLGEFFLFLIAMIFDRSLGYRLTLTASFLLGVILAAVFASIFFANLAVIYFRDKYRKKITRRGLYS